MKKSKNIKENLTIEEAFERLEDVTNKLKSSAISIDESFKYYEMGMQYYEDCEELLGNAQQKITVYDKESNTNSQLETY